MKADVLEDRGAGLPPEGTAERPEGEGGGLLGDPRRFGLLLFMGTVSMLFIGFTSTYIVRESGSDWRPLPIPPVLWANTLALLLSSFTLERSRRLLRGWDLPGMRTWLFLTGTLGFLFVGGQFLGWRTLRATGIYLSTNIHSSFFYLLTGLHAAHLLGGLIWFLVLLRQASRLALTPGTDELGLFATYWHFLGGLWLYLLFLLFVL